MSLTQKIMILKTLLAFHLKNKNLKAAQDIKFKVENKYKTLFSKKLLNIIVFIIYLSVLNGPINSFESLNINKGRPSKRTIEYNACSK